MGVTPRRVAFAALVLASVLLPLRGPYRYDIAPPVDDRGQRLSSLTMRERSATYLWSALEFRDSALRVIASDDGVNRPPRIALHGFPAGASDPEADALVAGIWKRIGLTDSSVRMAIIVSNSDQPHSNHYIGTLITRRDGRTWCVAAGVGSLMAGHVQIWKHYLESAIAPCTFLAAFGLPGDGVRSWLETTRYAPVQSDSWLSGRKDITDRQGPWLDWDQADIRWILRPPLLLRVLGSLDFTTLLMPPYGFGATGLQCITGDRAACRRAVMHPAIQLPGNTEFPADLTVSTWTADLDTITLGTVRPPVPSLASAMVTEHDRSRFRRFWKSDRPVDQAFQDAFGESLGAWTARWAAREWQASFLAKYRGPEILLGVTLDRSWPFLVMAWSGVAVLVASWVARRRTA